MENCFYFKEYTQKNVLLKQALVGEKWKKCNTKTILKEEATDLFLMIPKKNKKFRNKIIILSLTLDCEIFGYHSSIYVYKKEGKMMFKKTLGKDFCGSFIKEIDKDKFMISNPSNQGVLVMLFDTFEKLGEMNNLHQNPIICVECIDEKKQIFASGCEEGKIVIWQINKDNTIDIIQDLEDHTDAIGVMRYSKKHQVLISGGGDNRINIYKYNNIGKYFDLHKEILTSFHFIQNLDLKAEIGFLEDRIVFSDAYSNICYIYSIDGEQIKRFKINSIYRIVNLRVIPNSERILLGSPKKIVIFNLNTKEQFELLSLENSNIILCNLDFKKENRFERKMKKGLLLNQIKDIKVVCKQ